MKGVILKALKEAVIKNAGEEVWEKAIKGTSLEKTRLILDPSDYPDNDVYTIVGNLKKILNTDDRTIFRIFAEYWVLEFAPKVYKVFYQNFKSPIGYLEMMDEVHTMVTQMLENAHPPRFFTQKISEKEIIMEYKSQRPLFDLFIELVRAVGKYFGKQLEIKVIGENKVHIKQID